ncbi:hypothetical protein [Micromonospora sp. CA-246542]|uniref:hypothetical protein n=1 Tax=Micromonospora sp. CA-246542 TaxID=3239959 RepID=UPI003D8F5290
MKNQFPPEPLPMPMSSYRDCPTGDDLAVILKRLSPLMGGATPRPGRMWLPDDLRGDVDALSINASHRRIVWMMPYHFTAYMSEFNAYRRYLESLFGVTCSADVGLLMYDMIRICRTITSERQAMGRARARERVKKKAA